MSRYYRTQVTASGATTLTFYVRPTAGGPYGDGDGTSYDNAWSGFSQVGSLQQNAIVDLGGKLAVCETHNEVFSVLANSLEVIGNDINAAGIINGQNTRNTGITITGKTGIVINSLSCINHTVANLLLQTASTCTTTNCTFSGSGNQGVQHYDTSSATHNFATINNCTDEAISCHDTSTTTIYGGQFHSNVNAFVNVSVGGCIVNVSNVWDVSGSKFALQGNVGAIFNVSNCRLNKIYTEKTCTYNFTDCYISRSGTTITEVDDCFCNINAVRTTFDLTNYAPANGGLDMQANATLTAKYCIFKGMQSGKYAILMRPSSIVGSISNCVFYGNPSTPVGIAIFRTPTTGPTFTVRNCIFRGLANIDNTTGITFDYCSFTSNTSNGSGTKTNSVNSNPLFTDPTTNDFSLQAGSPMIGAGVTVSGVGDGILTANWGSASAAPEITSGAPSVPPNIGAYV